jgi:hypothetical protein
MLKIILKQSLSFYFHGRGRETALKYPDNCFILLRYSISFYQGGGEGVYCNC